MTSRPNKNALAITPAQKALLNQAPNIYLIGLMGAGKSTAGRLLAQTMGREFYDSDDEIVKRTGASIPTIFEIEGEAGFREREQRMIAELCAKKSVILGTGGGAILREANREALKNTGWVVYLSTSPERLINRTRYDKNRPLLQTANPLSVLTQLYEVRHPIYQDLADIVITTGAGHVTHVVAHIIEQLIARIGQNLHAQ
jgi:shikimate kinase